MKIAIAGAKGGIGSAIVGQLLPKDVIIQRIPKEDTEAPECDVLILVSGIGHFGPLEEIDEGMIEQMRWVNLERHILLVKSIIGKWKERKSGHIIFICSNSAYTGISGNQVYAATKAGLLGFARCLSEEVKKLGIKVTTISPGTTNTEFWKEAGRDNRLFCVPIEPYEIGQAVKFCIECPCVVTEMTILPREKC